MAKEFMVFYDLDGTLVDSIPSHMKFLRDMNKRFNCKLSLPDPHNREACKDFFDTSTLRNFIKKAGFPEEFLEEIAIRYKEDFKMSNHYHMEFFDGVESMIKNLGKKGIGQGILTSNSIDKYNGLFDKKEAFKYLYPIIDRIQLDSTYSGRKSSYLNFHRGNNFLLPGEMVYVGDTINDYHESIEAEVPFIGVTYGFQLDKSQKNHVPFPLVDNIKDLEKKIIEISGISEVSETT
ncbi:HAD hydrolase-like protein [Candidatus Pacearchaeota archaeon]|nr:HAD hydrolase-like protein [Candidatus Pacearchaeota archaeon]